MKIFITGIFGQVGSHIAEYFLYNNCSVLGIDNFKTGKPYHLKKHKNLKTINGSIANKDLVESMMKDFSPEVVIHAAASYKDPTDWYNDTLTNCVGSAILIRLSIDLKIKRFIYFQTALCYGTKPLENPITLNHPKLPANSSYAISKTAAEDYLEISGLDYVSFRLANVIGPRNLAGVLPTFYKRLKEGKKCFVTKARRNFIDVNDLVEIVVKAVKGTGQGSYHFSSGKDIEIKELYDLVVKNMKLNSYPEPDIKEIQADEAPSILLDSLKTINDFGENLIKFSLDETVKRAIEYYEKFGVDYPTIIKHN